MSQRGQSVLYAVLLMPTLLMMVALVADVGSLQVHRVQLGWANDMALVDAATEIDPGVYSSTARLALDATAADVFRRYLVLNLEPLRGQLAGATPELVAQQAEVAVINAIPAANPFSGRRLDRPAICARVQVRFPTGLLSLAGLHPVQAITVSGDAQIKLDGP